MEGKGEQLDSAFLPRVTIHAWLTMAFFIFRHEACPISISISITEQKSYSFLYYFSDPKADRVWVGGISMQMRGRSVPTSYLEALCMRSIRKQIKEGGVASWWTRWSDGHATAGRP